MVSFEEPASINIDRFLTILRQINSDLENAPMRRSNFAIDKNQPICIVVEGFLLFALSNDVTSMFDIRIFLDSTQSRCRMQRFRRKTHVNPKMPDSQVAITDHFSRWYDNLVWPEYLKRRDLQMANAEKVFKPEEYQDRNYTKLDTYIDQRVKEIV
ncbi:unnamed protein product [Rotaria sp. Silwood1]|nr:unnamed protein product [Rotaria sp. Silwood1]CAF5134758.1 unnamed protein product [Rotaria sp. Silwood1]